MMMCRHELKRIRRANKRMLASGDTMCPPAGAEAILNVDSLRMKCFLLGLPRWAPDAGAYWVRLLRSDA